MTEKDPTSDFVNAVVNPNPGAMTDFLGSQDPANGNGASPDNGDDIATSSGDGGNGAPNGGDGNGGDGNEGGADPSGGQSQNVNDYVKGIFGEDYNESITPELVKTTFVNYNKTQSRLEQLEAELNKYKDVAELVNNPYPSERIARLAAAERMLKISDPQIVDIMSTATTESLNQDPVTALAIARVLAKPELLSKGVTFSDIKEMASEELGGYEDGDKLTSTQKVKLTEALYDIAAKQKELQSAPINLNDIIAKNREVRDDQVKATIQELSPITNDVVGTLKKEFAESGLPIVLDEAKVTPFVSQMLEGFAKQGAKAKDVSSEMVKSYARLYAIEQAGGLQGIGKAYKQSLEAAIKDAQKNVAQSVHNGGQVSRPAAPGANQNVDKTKAFVENTIREINKPIPN